MSDSSRRGFLNVKGQVIYAMEIQKQLIENRVVLPANVPSQPSITIWATTRKTIYL